MKKNFALLVLLFGVIFMIPFGRGYSQSEENSNDFLIDSLQSKEDLLDSNGVYKALYDSLNNDGKWVAIKKSEFVLDVAGEEANVNDIEYADNDYIYVWQPFVSNYENSWSPYTYGRWVFTYYGWIWVSSYNWGWGPYHYGRWWYSPFYGWVWLPGRIWAPNWCMWRHYDNYIGWYPRGPKIWWHDRHHRRRCNNVVKTNPKHWVVIQKKDFTKNITKDIIVNDETVIKKSTQVKLNNDPSIQVKYNGPNVKNISTETGVVITPKKVKGSEVKSNTTVGNESVNVYIKDPRDINKINKETKQKQKDNDVYSTDPVTKQKDNNSTQTKGKQRNEGTTPKSENPNDGSTTPKTKKPKDESTPPKTEKPKKEYSPPKQEKQNEGNTTPKYEKPKKENKSYDTPKNESKPRNENKNNGNTKQDKPRNENKQSSPGNSNSKKK